MKPSLIIFGFMLWFSVLNTLGVCTPVLTLPSAQTVLTLGAGIIRGKNK